MPAGSRARLALGHEAPADAAAVPGATVCHSGPQETPRRPRKWPLIEGVSGDQGPIGLSAGRAARHAGAG